MTHAEKAKQLFLEGYNCAQAVFCAFEDVTDLERETAAKIASSFGGGMGRMREVCGAVSGALMTYGTVKGYSDPKDMEGKKEQYVLIQEFARQFKEENGSIICRELLAGVPVTNGSSPEARTETYYKKRPCAELVNCAAEIMEKLLQPEA